MSVLLIGATGLLGQALDHEGRARGRQILGAARKGADWRVDLAEEGAVGRLIEKTAPTIVINAAALTDLQECERDPATAMRINAGAVGEMAQKCAQAGLGLVHVSSDHFFTGDGDQLHDEDASVSLVNSYARSKFAGEKSAMAMANALVIRTNVTGLRGWAQPTFYEWALDALRRHRPLALFGDYFTSTIDAASLARAIFDLIDRGTAGRLNVASREVASKRRFVEALAGAIGVRLDWAIDASVRSLPVARAESLGLDVSRAEKLLGYPLPDLPAVIARLVASTEVIDAV